MINVNHAVHVHEDDLELYIRGHLELERIPMVESHLSECESCRWLLSDCLGQGLALHLIKSSGSNAVQKRSEPRFSAEGEATVQELHPISFGRHKVKVVNVSQNGLGISGSKAISPGTIVQLRINGTIVLGNVRYCSLLGDCGFRIGVNLHGEG
jgi:hypothetical protein